MISADVTIERGGSIDEAESETETGLMGIGEGGERRTMEECARMLIGLDSFRIDQHWQRMIRGYFYPAGREKLHSLGALDVALWDLNARAASSRVPPEC